MQALVASGSLAIALVLAYFNYRYLRLTRMMVDESRNGYMNAAIPVIRIELAPYGSRGTIMNFSIVLMNDGLGPAIDVRAILPDDLQDLLVLTVDGTIAPRVLGPGQHSTLSAVKPFSTEPGRIRDRKLEALADGDIVITVRYTDVYGRPFSSTATLSPTKKDGISSTPVIKEFDYVTPTSPSTF